MQGKKTRINRAFSRMWPRNRGSIPSRSWNPSWDH